MTRVRLLAPLPLGFFAAHAAFHLAAGRPEELLWTCTAANLVLAVGLLVPSANLVAVALAWLVLGNALWTVDLCSGGAFYPTSLLTHLGGAAVAIVAVVTRLGWPAGAWWRAVVLLFGLQSLCRLVTPPAANVNLAFDLYPGMELYFPTYRHYWAALLLLSAATFFAAERLFRALARPTTLACSPR